MKRKEDLPKRIVVGTTFPNVVVIRSYGLIVYNLKTKKYLMVRRKHTIDFLLLLQGRYRFSQLSLMLSKITLEEKNLLSEALLANDFRALTLEVGFEITNQIKTDKNDVLQILSRLKLNNQLEWYWPKGRRNYDENAFACAMREFKEEVGIELTPALNKIENPIYQSESQTYNLDKIMNYFWLYVIEDEIALPKPNSEEISMTGWFSIEEVRKHISENEYEFITRISIL